ncbi:hypothetical protein GQX74_007613 [Glossina fuscipes]|nr:hypothetical protein GQX74_007613 [Glossina fuscipes]
MEAVQQEIDQLGVENRISSITVLLLSTFKRIKAIYVDAWQKHSEPEALLEVHQINKPRSNRTQYNLLGKVRKNGCQNRPTFLRYPLENLAVMNLANNKIPAAGLFPVNKQKVILRSQSCLLPKISPKPSLQTSSSAAIKAAATILIFDSENVKRKAHNHLPTKRDYNP